MNAIHNRHYIFILCFTFMILVISSCFSQSQSNQQIQEVQLNDEGKSHESITDTALRLKYTTGIRAILEDGNGNIWFGSHQEGVCLFDGKKLIYFTEEDGLCNNQVRSIFEDANGMVWFEGGSGISSYDGNKIVTHTDKDYSSKKSWQAHKNDIWFKGDESVGYNKLEGHPGIYRYDGNKLSYLEFPIILKEGEESTYSVSTPFNNGKNGKVWFGTYGAVIGYEPSVMLRGGGTGFTIIDDKSLGFNEETGYLHIRSILEDSKGNLWIGNNGIGVLLYDGGTTINFSESQGLLSESSLRRGGYRSPSNSLEHVFSIGEDANGNIWFGDRDTGAWRYDPSAEHNKMTNFTIKDGLTSNFVLHIYNTKNGDLWFGMEDGKVLKFTGESFVRVF